MRVNDDTIVIGSHVFSQVDQERDLFCGKTQKQMLVIEIDVHTLLYIGY